MLLSAEALEISGELQRRPESVLYFIVIAARLRHHGPKPSCLPAGFWPSPTSRR